MKPRREMETGWSAIPLVLCVAVFFLGLPGAESSALAQAAAGAEGGLAAPKLTAADYPRIAGINSRIAV